MTAEVEITEVELDAVAEIIQIETMEVKLEAEVVEVPTDIETKEPLEVKPESVEMTDEQQMTEEEPGTVAEVTPDETMEGNPEAGVLEKANDKKTSQPKAVVFQILETTLDVSEANEVTSEPEMIEVESKLDETMEVKPESVDLTTEPEMNEAELDAVANFMPDETMEGIPETVEMTDEQQMTEEEPGTVAEVIPDETMEAKPDTGVLEDATDTETSQPEAVVFHNLETTLDVAKTEEVTFEPEMIEAESVDTTAEVEVELDAV